MQIKTNWMSLARRLVKVDFRNEPRSADIGEYHRKIQMLSRERRLKAADPSEQLIKIYKQLPWTRDYIFHYRGTTPDILDVVFRYDPHLMCPIVLRNKQFRFNEQKYATPAALKRAIQARSKQLESETATAEQIAKLRKAEAKVVQILDKIAYQKSTNPLRWGVIYNPNVYVIKINSEQVRSGVSQRRMKDAYRVFILRCETDDWPEDGASYLPTGLLPALRRRLKKMGRLDEVKL